MTVCYNYMIMKQLFRGVRQFFGEYKQFGMVVLSLLIALGLRAGGLHSASDLVLIIAAGLNVIPLVWGMIQDIRSGIYGVDILAATAIISSVLFKEFWAGMVIVFMLTGGEALEDYAERRAKTELSALLDRAPTKAHVLRGRKEVDIPASEVRVGDKLIVKPGEVVPVDAVVIEGLASFDESSLTGESLPVSKRAGDDLLSGSINQDGAVTVKASASAADSQYQQIIKLVKVAESNRSPFVRLADRYSIPFTLLAFTIAFGAWALSGESIRFLEVLVVATPCPLILGAPIALISGMSRAAKHGIIVKTGGALEQLAAAKTIGFDKTGTLTVGQPKVSNITTFGKRTQSSLIALAAALEQNSNHVLAQAIVDKADSINAKIPKAKSIEEVPGLGLQATVQGQVVRIGRLAFMQERGIAVPKQVSNTKQSQTLSYVAVENELVGTIAFEDTLRTDAKSTLNWLKKLGFKHMLMVTGDNKATAAAIAKQLGIDQVQAESLPGDKIRAIENIQSKPVAFVGDGVNDAPVLAASDVGIALGARGSTAASESADVVIMLDKFEQVAVVVAVAKRTLRIAKQAILTGIFLSVLLMFAFASGRFKPIYGAAIQEVVDVIVILYALRAHSDSKKLKPTAS